MSIAKRCQHHFLSGDRNRGDLYFDEGRVSMRGGQDGSIYFEARGSQLYDVELRFDDLNRGVLSAWCNCPRFQGGTPCKHVWAALLEVDNVLDLPDGRKLRMEMQTLGREGDDDSLESVDQIVKTMTRIDAPAQRPGKKAARQAVAQPARKGKKKTKKKGKQKSWLTGIHNLANAIYDDEDFIHDDASTLDRFASKPTKLMFALVQEDYADYRGILLRLYRATRRMNGDWGVPQKTSFSRHELSRQPQHHAKLLQGLSPIFDDYSHYNSHIGEFTTAEGRDASNVIAQLANSGSLFWMTQPVGWRAGNEPRNSWFRVRSSMRFSMNLPSYKLFRRWLPTKP